MSTNKNGPSLSEVMVANAEIPEMIFSQSFEQYLFFDADLATSKEMTDAIRLIVKSCGYHEAGVDVFASWDRIYRFHLEFGIAWYEEIVQLRKSQHKDGDFGGIALTDPKHRWIVYQYLPGEIGVLAINSRLEFDLIKDVKDCFFHCSDLERWRRRETQRDIGKVENIGVHVLTALIRNYC